MLFSSEIFLFLFLPLTILIYFLIPKKGKNLWLLISSLIFYGWSNLKFLTLLLLSILFNYIFAIFIEKSKEKYKKILLISNIILNIGILFVFKYSNFVIETVNSIFNSNFNLINLILPVGISFYTFQGLSYIIDVYRKKVSAQKNIINLALYISFFPQLIAGPIVKYADIEKKLESRTNKIDDFIIGIKRFTIGLSKKTILADNLAVVADSIWGLEYTDLTSGVAWIGVIFYTMQIYFDFSGYSDMAIGLGKMFGFDFMDNFNYPYISKSISEFWRRWHISLSNWFKDYIYIPLGGKNSKMVRNLLIVFLLTGIWHGAGITFIIWGLYNGILIVFEKILKKRKKTRKENILIRASLHIYLLLTVMIGWVIFRSTNLEQTLMFLRTMFFNDLKNFPLFDIGWYLTKYNLFILIISLIFCTPVVKILYKKIKKDTIFYNVLEYFIIIFLLIYSIMNIISNGYNPFIYFQF